MNPSQIIPTSAQTIIADFFVNQGTGQVSLNFHEGQIKSWDFKRHEKATGPVCAKCKALVSKNNGGWSVKRGEIRCASCP